MAANTQSPSEASSCIEWPVLVKRIGLYRILLRVFGSEPPIELLNRSHPSSTTRNLPSARVGCNTADREE